MNLYKTYFLFLLVSVCLGCKSTKSLTAEGTIKDNLSAKQIIKENQKQVAQFKTLQARVKVDYIEGNKSQGYTVNLRMEKDKAIWLNAAFSVVRVMITPEKVSYYNKLSDEYFDGDYSLLTEFLGVELDYTKVQNLLLGETLYNLKDGNYISSDNEVSYILQPENQQALFEIFYLLNPGHFKVDSQQLAQPAKKRLLEIDYKAYQLVGKQIFPEVINIIALEENDEVRIDLELKSVTLNEDLRFPFSIPSGYKQIEVK